MNFFMFCSNEQILIYNVGLFQPNPDDARPIVRCPMGHPITVWIQTRYFSDTSWIEMQCRRPLLHPGVFLKKVVLMFVIDHYEGVPMERDGERDKVSGEGKER